METRCKFCGKKINGTHYLTPVEQHSCAECGSHCMKQCPEAAKCGTSWHKEPCVSCTHNPYQINYVWDGGQWVKSLLVNL